MCPSVGAVLSVRGYLWENLREEIEAEFAQPHPLSTNRSLTVLFQDWKGWHVGDKVPFKSKKPKKPPRVLKGRENWRSVTESVRDMRDRRRAAGECIDCGEKRDPKSKNFCTRHREADRLRAEKKRRRRGVRERIKEATRPGVTQHFTIITLAGEVDGYITTGEYANGQLGEVFVKIGKPGGEEAMFDQWAIAVSVALQYGAPVKELLGKFAYTKFQPAGAVRGVAGIKRCDSPLDLICRYLIDKYGDKPILPDAQSPV